MKRKKRLMISMLTALALSWQAKHCTAKTIDFGNYHALLIANQNYTHWRKLETPFNDIRLLQKILTDKYGFKIQVLRDATAAKIIDKLEEYRRNLTGRDNLLIYFAGHGKLRRDGGYWIGIDATTNSRGKWVSFRTISDLVDRDNDMRARHVLVIADSCYAGAFMRAEENAVPRRGADESEAAWFARMNRNPCRRALASGGSEPVLDRAGGGDHSIFAGELASELKKNNGILMAARLHALIQPEVYARAGRYMGADAQVPQYAPIPGSGDLGGDFLFVPKGYTLAAGEEIKNDSSGRKGDFPIVKTRILTNSLEMAFVWIPPGKFAMGSPAREIGREADEIQHQVTLDQGFYLGKIEVTVGQFRKFVDATGYKTEAETDGGAYQLSGSRWKKAARISWNFPGFKQTERHPVTCVSWNDVQAFIKWLHHEDGLRYRLPTEAEWEYAARGGTSWARYWGEDAGRTCDYANVADQRVKTKFPKWVGLHPCVDGYIFTAPVGLYQENGFGLHDMIGNVFEWCLDRYGPYPTGSVKNPQGAPFGVERVLRGCAWNSDPGNCRSAFRFGIGPGYRFAHLGFRLVCLEPDG